jgi:hypothetical protein
MELLPKRDINTDTPNNKDMISGNLTVADEFLRKDVRLKDIIVENTYPDSPGSDNDAEDGDPYDDNLQNLFENPDDALVGFEGGSNKGYYYKKYLKYKNKYYKLKYGSI